MFSYFLCHVTLNLVRSLRLVRPEKKFFFPILMNFGMYIEIDEWCTIVCRMTRSEMKVKVTSNWKPLKRSRLSVPHGAKFFYRCIQTWITKSVANKHKCHLGRDMGEHIPQCISHILYGQPDSSCGLPIIIFGCMTSQLTNRRPIVDNRWTTTKVGLCILNVATCG